MGYEIYIKCCLLNSFWKVPMFFLQETKKLLLNLSVEIGKTVSTLHKNNIIHGDLTTSNILVETRLVSDPLHTSQIIIKQTLLQYYM